MNNKGQVLVGYVLIGIISLSVVIILSSRYIASLRNKATVDNSKKAQIVAESLAERLLSKSDETLFNYIKNNNCGQDCYLSFSDGSEATATLSYLGNSSDPYELKIKKDDIAEINLSNFESNKYIDLCWNRNASIAAMYLSKNGDDYLISNYAANAMGSTYSSDFGVSSTGHGFANCIRVDAINDPVILRIKSLYEESTINVFSENNISLPLQGYKLSITGRFLNEYKNVVITKRSEMSIEMLDYVLYQKSLDTALSK